MTLAEVSGMTYHIDKRLYKKWLELREGKLAKLDEDRVYIVDGRERVGKSYFAIQQACFIDPTLVGDVSRICFDPEQLLYVMRKTKSDTTKTKCVVFDEAFRGLSIREVLSRTNKIIVQTLMEMGQSNLVVFIVLPSFFMLDYYAAVLRSHALFHIYKKKNSKIRKFLVFNEQKKSLIYKIGKQKGWSYNATTYLRGNFYNKFPGGDEFLKMYLDKKRKSFEAMSETLFEKQKQSRFVKERNVLAWILNKKIKWSHEKISDEMKNLGVGHVKQAVQRWVYEINEELKGNAPANQPKTPQNNTLIKV